MVNVGRPSRACSACKQRKLKCDEMRPACTRCIKAGWDCPGYRPEIDALFRDQTYEIMKKVKSEQKLAPPGDGRSTKSDDLTLARVQEVFPPARDCAISFFISRYVFTEPVEGKPGASRGNLEYLPALMQRDHTGILHDIIAASGLAAVANASNSTDSRLQAYSLYGNVIRQLKVMLNNPDHVKDDQTLAAIMLMGTFETIASADADSMKSFSNHILAAARCIELRGPFQFRNEASVKLFLELRRLFIMTLHQLQEPVPYAVARWSSWVEPIQHKDDLLGNHFSEINERLAEVRAEIKYRAICTPSTIVSMLLPIDEELESWRRSLPPSWQYKSIQSSHPGTETYGSHFDIYSNIWIASTWNNYRSVRFMIYEHIMSTVLKYGREEEDKAILRTATTVLREMTDGVCSSVPYHFGRWKDSHTGTKMSNDGSIPGGYLIIWPLYLSGMLHTTPTAQKHWIAAQLKQIAIRMGLRLAYSMSEQLLKIDKSFSDSSVWFIGEWYPR